VLCSWKLALSNGVIVLPLSVVVSVEINWRHYFWRTLLSNRNSGEGKTLK
jgi:hypothetical protein